MDFVSPILEIVNRLWDCCDKRAVFIRQLPENLKSLRDEMEELKNVYRDVKKRVEDEQKLQKEIKHVVTGWIRSVESMEGEVNEMLTKGEEEIKKKSQKLNWHDKEMVDRIGAVPTQIDMTRWWMTWSSDPKPKDDPDNDASKLGRGYAPVWQLIRIDN